MAGMHITAKVKLGTKFQQTDGNFGLYFYPDYYGDKAETNKAWATATPSLVFQMNVRPDVAEKFEQGASYTVTFTPEEVQNEEVPDGSDSAS